MTRFLLLSTLLLPLTTACTLQCTDTSSGEDCQLKTNWQIEREKEQQWERDKRLFDYYHRNFSID